MRRRSSPSRPSKDQLAATKDEVARRTAGAPDGSLRIDPKLLDDGQARELVELTTEEKALSEKQRARWEALVELAAEKPGLFEDLRGIEEIQRQGRELRRQVVRRPFSRREEQGILAELGAQIGQFLNADHVALMVLLLIAFETGRPLGQRQRIETAGEDTVLVIDQNWGLIASRYDDDGLFAGFKRLLAHLDANAWTVTERNGTEWRITLGPRAKRAMRGTKAKAAA